MSEPLSVPALGVDVGGTFTDFFSFGPDGLRAWKRLSTPDAPGEAVLAGVGRDTTYSRVVHGSTVATNALLERRGPRTVLVTTAGFKDILEIRRQERPELYALEPSRPPHVVPRGAAVEVRERLDAGGAPVIPLEDAEVARVIAEVRALKAESVAVCLLFAFRNSDHERRIAAGLRDAGFDVSASHEVLPEYREYERASTTAINAFLRPAVSGYLARLESAIPRLRVMHSAAAVTTPAAAAERPVSMVVSGPAGGVLGALAVARAAGFPDIVTFDMGGTSTDVALCDGEPRYRTSAEIDGLAINTPMVDLITVGAGGGSIARIDAGGALVVGPESAGAEPGPACYGRGDLPTVSDANVVLGRLRADHFLGGAMTLDLDRAAAALSALGEPVAAATAIVEVVNANMARALRAVSLERGFDPSGFTLVAFGGAGPLHACELAAELGMPRVLIPRHPGVLSALGMVTASEAIERSRGTILALDAEASPPVASLAADLSVEVAAAFAAAAPAAAGADSWAADLRYRGQAHELRVAFGRPHAETMTAAFHLAHDRRYGYAEPGRPVELVSLRLRRSAPPPPLPFERATAGSPHPPPVAETIAVTAAGVIVHTPRYDRESMDPGSTFTGPAVVTQLDATTYVPPGWRCVVDDWANLILEPARD